jgi:hypothetical protein
MLILKFLNVIAIFDKIQLKNGCSVNTYTTNQAFVSLRKRTSDMWLPKRKRPFHVRQVVPKFFKRVNSK